MIKKVKIALRLKNSAFDDEIEQLIEAAKIDLKNSGLGDSVVESEDPLIQRAISIYCQMNFGIEIYQYERLKDMYTSLVVHLSMVEKYRHSSNEKNQAGGDSIE